ncbi:YqgE/AlgH family protein [Neptunomonas antarctica]|uniref:UPF0301 protein SAMN05421760_101462 n=1 Tax=Neptunomonas antarctica TaxID=619304 RepID=A0A1N7J1J4_9GAMM|nr:YqgE/AlgH family protein [Neptunomonas antarctica]SIS43127.1 putative transcriptional regulator [Neptunomonas antarctica]
MLKFQTCLRDHFLISMPHLDDENFVQTIIYLCDHSEYGAMGLIVNRPLNFHLDNILDHLELPAGHLARSIPVYSGGPVQNNKGFVLHKAYLGNPWLSTHTITNELFLTTSFDILEAFAQSGSADALIALGCSCWGPGQLEQEISDNAWLSCPANSDIMFNMPAADRMQAGAAILGINLHLLTAHSGHA